MHDPVWDGKLKTTTLMEEGKETRYRFSDAAKNNR
jgi:hypothetical protein